MIAFRHFKNSPLIIEIAERIKINRSKAAISIQRVRAVTYFLQIASFDIFYARVVTLAAIAQVWINLHRQHVFYTIML